MKTPSSVFRPGLRPLSAGLPVLLLSAILSSCSDDLDVPRRFLNDGSVAFEATEGLAGTRAFSGPAWQGSGSLDCTQGADSLWLHISEAENMQLSTADRTLTRGNPHGSGSTLSSFTVTATTGRENGSEQIFINDQVAAVSGDLWLTDDTYYWPQSPVTFYAIAANPLGLTSSDLTNADGVSRMDYVVPTGSGDKLGRDAETQPDLLLATRTMSRPDDGIAPMQFRHPLSGIYLTADETVLNVGIESVSISGVHGSGTLSFEGGMEHSPSSWTLTGLADATFTQKIDSDAASEFVVNGSTVESLCQPFMMIPHKEMPEGAELVIVLSDGDTRHVPLSSIFRDGWKAGRIYRIHLSKLNALYPPVRDLQGMAGNNTISLTWFYPNPGEIFDHVHQVGVYIEVDQFATVGDADGFQGPTVSTKIYWPGALTDEEGWPSESSLLDLFAEVTAGVDEEGNPLVDEDGNPLKIDTRDYDRFKVRVYAAYRNQSDSHLEGTDYEIHLSDPTALTIDRVRSNDVVAFYLPEGRDKSKPDPVDQLLDDDDKAAAAWFRQNFAKGVFVDKDTFDKYEFDVLWLPCGVKLKGNNQHDEMKDGDVTWEHYWTSKASYILTTMDLKDTSLEFMQKFLKGILWLPNYPDFHGNPGNLETFHEKTYEEVFKKNEAGGVSTWKNLYDDGVILSLPKTKDGKDAVYLSETDCKTIRRFYRSGGNLLLTSFALEMVEELGVEADGAEGDRKLTPKISMFNEVKQPAVWFVNPLGMGDHAIYKGLFKVVPETFRDVYYSDFMQDENGNYKIGDYKLGHVPDYDNEACFLAGKLGVPMIPLLSNHARSCENNNIVWDGQGTALEYSGGKVLGTWGQREDEVVGCIVEFAAKSEHNVKRTPEDEGYAEHGSGHNGRCICIGLGAYEFNNGSKYDPTLEVMNTYQSNVHLLTKNALEYLLSPQQ